MFKIGDIVILRVSGNFNRQKRLDIGKEAVIVGKGQMYDWRINMLYRGTRVNGGYDWGANNQDIEFAGGGPW